jgi:hypothetical protein
MIINGVQIECSQNKAANKIRWEGRGPVAVRWVIWNKSRALGKAEQRPILPTKEEIASWSILHPDEIEAARKNESKPWPQHDADSNAVGHLF